MEKLGKILLGASILICMMAQAQTPGLDTLLPQLKKANDIQKAELYNKIGKEYSRLDPNKAFEYFMQALEIAKKKDQEIEIGNAHHNIGLIHYMSKDYDEALGAYLKAIKVRENIEDNDGLGKTYNNVGIIKFEIGKYAEAIAAYKKAVEYKEKEKDFKGKANTLMGIGNVYIQMGNNSRALENLQEALKVFKQINPPFKEGLYKCLNSIGVTYGNIGQDKYPMALEFQKEALQIAEELDNPMFMSEAYSNIGNTIYSLEDDSIKQGLLKTSQKKRFARALFNYMKALELRQKIEDKRGIANTLGNIGIVYTERGEYKLAMDYYQKSLAMNLELNNQFETALIYKELGRIEKEQGNYKGALENLLKSLELTKQIKALTLQKTNSLHLADVYYHLGDFKKAYEFKLEDSRLQDSIWNKNSQKALSEFQTMYDTEKKEHALQLAKKESEGQQRIIYLGAIFLILILGALVIVFSLYGKIKTQNTVLHEQKEEINKQLDIITEQKKEITDSIHYAERIQRAILPRDENIAHHLPDHFVLFRPRDIVSGDFYWFAYHNEKIIIAAADCTGHGVPGAFMSMLGVTILNEIVKNAAETPRANDIVTRLREMIIATLSQSASSTSTKDGMDIALCVIDKATMKLEYAGAHNPLYMIRNGELTEIDADHMPVGVYEVMKPFTLNEIDLQTGDSFFIFSDGFCDQFGGAKGKKFKSKPFKEILVGMHDKPLKEQGIQLEKVRLEWLGTEYEQIDDVIVIGFRI